MKQLLIEIDDALAERLDKIAPARSRRRSGFIRQAIQRALWDIEERMTAEAYRARPDSGAEAYFDPAVWAAAPPKKSAARARKRSRS